MDRDEYKAKLGRLTDLISPFDVETVEEQFTGRLRWGKGGSLQQERKTIYHPTGAVRVGWVVVPTEE